MKPPIVSNVVVALALHLGLLKFYADGAENVALRRGAYASSDMLFRDARDGVDGDPQKCLTTSFNGLPKPWFDVDLYWTRYVGNISITNSDDSPDRMRKLHLGVTNISPVVATPDYATFDECAYYEGPAGPGETRTFSCPAGGLFGRYVVVQAEHDSALSVCELQVFESERRDWLKFTYLKGRKVSGHVMRNVYVSGPVECSGLCLEETTCTSASYQAESGACELHDSTDIEEFVDGTSAQGWTLISRQG